mmetsp:Transcript_27703/g.81417  ORF Transcript_27703/g.81417 Transcript_27703/m.81417 type:complete len:235 (-) Transcript_27703:476-1180(-)
MGRRRLHNEDNLRRSVSGQTPPRALLLRDVPPEHLPGWNALHGPHPGQLVTYLHSVLHPHRDPVTSHRPQLRQSRAPRGGTPLSDGSQAAQPPSPPHRGEIHGGLRGRAALRAQPCGQLLPALRVCIGHPEQPHHRARATCLIRLAERRCEQLKGSPATCLGGEIDSPHAAQVQARVRRELAVCAARAGTPRHMAFACPSPAPRWHSEPSLSACGWLCHRTVADPWSVAQRTRA